MEKFDLLLDKAAETQSKELAKLLNKLSKKLKSFCYCPVTEKEFSRMEEFSTNPELVQIVLNILKEYKIDNTYKFYEFYDTVGYWYCIALISYSADEESINFLSKRTDELIAEKSTGTDLMYRNFDYFNNPKFQDIFQRLIDYFKKLNDECPVYEFVNEVGLIVPEEGDWDISFTLRNYDNSYNAVNTVKYSQRYTLDVKFFTPYGNGKCFKLDFEDMENYVHMHIDNIDPYQTLSRGGVEDIHVFESANDILKLKETVSKLESLMNIKFDHFEVYVPRGIKSRKILSDWIKTNLINN